ncbi:MAG: NAD-binding oxidoreductase [Spirochaetes bacterium GWF1_51_8]|nr:MAG: NAD-binding oxidoreductase [Spirochaetes bacterium GWF1_51_8]
MYKILKKKMLGSQIVLMDIEAPRVAKASLPGQFVIVIMDEKGERIPLTVCDYDIKKGTVTIVFQTVGDTTRRMAGFREGDSFFAFTGPLGHPSDFVKEPLEEVKKKKFIFIGGGVGVAPVYPQVKWLKEHEVDVDVIMGARNKDLIILEDEMKKAAKDVYVCTDDGSYGFHGLVTDCLTDLVKNKGKSYDHAVIIGPMIMMKFAAKLTKELGIPTVVSLNTIMVDGTGMCGACRVNVGGAVKFACVDGPEFDGHAVDYDGAMRRMAMYKTEEGRKALRTTEGTTHKPEKGCGVQGAQIG